MSELFETVRSAHAHGRHVTVHVTEAWYSCCGRPARHRQGYEQTYRGRVHYLTDETFGLTAEGIGAPSYVVMVPMPALVDAELG